MPDPMEYNKQYKALRAKNANMIASVTKGKSKEELENMTNEQAVKAIEGTGDFLLFADDLEELNLNLFEAGMPDGWKLKYLSPEEFEELTKKVNNFFVPAKKTGGNTPPIQSGETL
jgi:adenylosuccinate lyase